MRNFLNDLAVSLGLVWVFFLCPLLAFLLLVGTSPRGAWY